MDIYAHRGAAGEAPENTIAGCLHAIDRGTRFLELDIRISADDQFVVIHDSNTSRTTGRNKLVKNCTAGQLGKMDAREVGPPWPESKDCHIPTLEAVLEATPECERYLLDLKVSSMQKISTTVKLLGDMFPNADSASRVVMVSSSEAFLNGITAEIPYLTTGLLGLNINFVWSQEKPAFEHILLPLPMCTPYHLRKLKNYDVKISVWPVNDPAMIKNLYRMSVDGVITDYPSMALPLVATMQRKKRFKFL